MDDKTKERLAEIGGRVDAIREHLPQAVYRPVFEHREFLYDLCQSLIKERDEARQWAEDWCMRELPWERTG